MGERVATLEDLLRPRLRAVCVGINPSPVSVEAGHYYRTRAQAVSGSRSSFDPSGSTTTRKPLYKLSLPRRWFRVGLRPPGSAPEGPVRQQLRGPQQNPTRRPSFGCLTFLGRPYGSSRPREESCSTNAVTSASAMSRGTS